MKQPSRPLVVFVSSVLALTSIRLSHAGSATWSLNPITGDWNTSSSWTPDTIPNGPTDVATFGVSNTTNADVSGPTEVDRVVFSPGASAYTISVASINNGLSILGAGIINQSGVNQTFVGLPDPTGTGEGGGIVFYGNSMLGENISLISEGNPDIPFDYGVIFFSDSSNAGNSTITSATGGGEVKFVANSSAANAVITNQGGAADGSDNPGFTGFFENSTAGKSTITNEAGTAAGFGTGAETEVYDSATLGTATITNKGTTVRGSIGGRTIFFAGTPTAGNATIINEGSSVKTPGGGRTDFLLTSTAGNATLIAQDGTNDGGLIELLDNSSGGNARIEVFGKGKFTIAAHADPGTAVGSIEGDGTVSLGDHNLTVGGNNLSTVYSGLIDEKLGGEGSLTKVGTGTLTLAGANNYSGVTLVSGGTLLASNTTGSATGSGPVQVDAGTFGGVGTVNGPVTIGNGTPGAFLAPGTHGPDTLTLAGTLLLKTGSGYKCELALTAQPKADQVVANGVTIESGVRFAPRSKGTRRLPFGTSLTLISNTGANPISGTFNNLVDGSTFIAGNNTFQANYEGGDGNDLTLTVIQ